MSSLIVTVLTCCKGLGKGYVSRVLGVYSSHSPWILIVLSSESMMSELGLQSLTSTYSSATGYLSGFGPSFMGSNIYRSVEVSGLEIAQLAFGKTPLRRPQTLRGRAKTQPPGAGCPRDVRDELRSKSGVSATEY